MDTSSQTTSILLSSTLLLPPNFDKYKDVITYFRNNGLDCLSTLQEQFRFFMRYIYDTRRISWNFCKQLQETTSLSTKYDIGPGYRWGVWSNPDIGCFDWYDIENLKFKMNGYGLFTINVDEEFLFKHLSLATDIMIMNYFQELYEYGNLTKIQTKTEYIKITNPFNDSVILIIKEKFKKYCRYDEFIHSYHNISNEKNEKIDTFSIDIEFNDEVSNNIEQLLNHNIKAFPKTMDSLKQQLEVIDFLQINMAYLK